MVKILVSFSLMYQRLLIRCDKGLLFKLRQLSIVGTLYDWIEHYLTSRSQKVVINGISSSLRYLQTGAPQGSILGPLLFLIYINDIMQCKLVCR